MSTLEPLLQVSELSKSFPGLRALDRVSFSLASGEILAIVGQNGSGKSTLVKTLTGVYQADAGGHVAVRAADGTITTGAAAANDLHVIHQDLGLVAGLSAVENLDLGTRHGARWMLPTQRRRERASARELIGRFGGEFDVSVPVQQLTPAERTLVAIARAMAGWDRPDNVLILDEPTAALHGAEAGRLFDAVRRVAAAGAGVIFISHRLDEVMQLCHRVLALRGGRTVADVRAGAFDHDDLVAMIAGGAVKRMRRRPAETTATVSRLEVRGLIGQRVTGVDLRVGSGEIVGISGLVGSGREHVGGLIFGAVRRSAGEVLIDDSSLPLSGPRAAITAGLGYVPADRQAQGAVLRMSARENLTLPALRGLVRPWGSVNARAERGEAGDWARRVALTPGDPERLMELFSGGNQQKVVLAKWLRLRPKVLVLDEPTQGVDIGAKEAIYRLIAEAAAQGAAVVVSSSDEQELCQLCDRVVVLREGRVSAEIAGADLTEARLVLQNLGIQGLPEASDQRASGGIV
jgi:ribose transport system ATP-binding protein